jgi:hypothetical protein
MCIPLTLLGNDQAKENFITATKIEATTEVSDASFSMRSVSYEKKVKVDLFPELLVCG